MPWFKVDDKMHDHRKVRAAGVAAIGLWTLAGSWSMDNLHDGFVPESVCSRWDRGYRKLAERLVEVGLWIPDFRDGESGWSFHDWKDRQPTKAAILQERHAATERQRKAREAAKSQRDSRRDSPVTHVDVEPSVTVPPSRPVPTRPNVQQPTVAAPPDLVIIEPEAEGARANRLAKTFTDKVKLSNFPAVAGVVRKAIKASYTDAQITAALARLADDGRSVTTDTLRIELEGKPPPGRNGTDVWTDAYVKDQRSLTQ